MPRGVVMAIRSAVEADLAAAIDSHPGLVVSRRCADLAEAVAAAEAGVGDVVVVSPQPHLNRASVRRMSKAGVPVVGVADGSKDADALAPLGLAHVFDASGGADGIVAGVARALADGDLEPVPVDPEPAPPAARGVVIAVWGPAGAPGRTTAAIEMAAASARDGSAVLVDADAYGASIAQRLGMLDEAPGIAALARAGVAGNVKAADVTRHALEVGGGLRVASGLSRPDRWPELSEAALEPVWEALRDASPVTVVDTHAPIEQADVGGRNAASVSALSAADAVVVVGAPDPVGIHRLVGAVGELADSGLADGAERLVVVNRLRASVAGARPAEAVADALARYASVDKVWTVPDDPAACDAALLRGASLAESAPKSPAAEAFAAVAAAALEAARAAVPAAP